LEKNLNFAKFFLPDGMFAQKYFFHQKLLQTLQIQQSSNGTNLNYVVAVESGSYTFFYEKNEIFSFGIKKIFPDRILFYNIVYCT